MSELALASIVRNFGSIIDEAVETGVLGPGIQKITHDKTDKLYYRICEIPAGSIGSTYVHKFAHVSVCLSGTVVLVNQDGEKRTVHGGEVFITPAGTQRALVALTDVKFMTVHAVDEINLECPEETLGYKTMDEYTRYITQEH